MHRSRFQGLALTAVGFLLMPPVSSQSSPLVGKVAIAQLHEAPATPRVKPGQLPTVVWTVRNPTARPVRPQGPLDHSEDWVFGRSARLVLRAPRGRLLEFRPTLLDLAISEIEPIGPAENRECYVFLSRYFVAREPGEYTLEIHAVDADDRPIRCAPFEFTIEAPAKATGDLSVELELGRADPSPPKATLRFRNTGRRPLTFIRPLDGSLWGWLEPHYWFEVRDARGRPVPLAARCGNHGGSYDERTLVTLAPGATEEIETYLPMTLAGGAYRVAFHYMMHARPSVGSIEAPFPPDRPATPFPKGVENLFLGVASARPVILRVPGPDPRDLLALPRSKLAATLLAALRATPTDATASAYALHLDVLQRLLKLGEFAAAERAAIRKGGLQLLQTDGTQSRRAGLLRALGPVLDATFVPALLATLRDPAATDAAYEASAALLQIEGKAAARPLIQALQRQTTDFDSLCLALGIVTGLHHNLLGFQELPGGGHRGRAAQTPAEKRLVRRRWLSWWKRAGPRWPK